VEYDWSEEQEESFTDLKTALIGAPCLRPLDMDNIRKRPPVLTVDAGPVVEGGFLGQDDKDGKGYAVFYFSGLWNSYERNYPQVKKELAALVKALKRSWYYVMGLRTIVEVDAKALIGMVNDLSITDAKMFRWLMYVRQFDIEFRHIRGKQNLVADSILRQHDLNDGENYFDVHKALKSGPDEELEKEIDRVLMTNLVMAEAVELEDEGDRSEETVLSAGGQVWAAKNEVKLHPSWAKLI
jgi:hypothetical protein